MAHLKRTLSAALLATATLGATAFIPAHADTAGVKVGVLTCNVAGGTGFIFGSSKDLACVYSPDKGPEDRYYGSVDKYGVDVGYTDSSRIVWAVFAPTTDVRQGALEGEYGGASASAAIGVGLGANVLVGGLDQSFALQPLSVEGQEGLNVAVGISTITLKSAPRS